MFLALLALLALGPETPVGSLSLGPAAGNQNVRSVVTNGRDFLALWADERASVHAFQPALFAGRLDNAGRPLEPTGHRLAEETLGGSLFRSNDSYLLLYTLASGFSYLQALDDDGKPVGAATRMDLAVAPRTFATNGRNLLALLNSGQVWLLSLDGTVLWKESLPAPSDASEIAVMPNGDYRFVTRGDGQVIVATVDGTTGFLTKRTLVSANRMGALVRGTTTFVAWTEGNAAKYEIVDGGPAVQFASDAGNAEVAVGWDGHEYAIALSSPAGLRISRVAADGRLLDPAPMAMPGLMFNVHFATTGTDTLMAGDRFNADFDVLDRASRGFDDLAAAQTNIVASSPNVQRFPRVAEGGLTLWREQNVMAQLPGGTPHTIVDGDIDVHAGRGASSYLAVWIADGKLWAKRLSFDGTPIDADPIFVADSGSVAYGFPETSPAIAFDGTDYLVVWPDTRGELHALRVAQNGHAVGAPVTLTDHGTAFVSANSARVVWNGTNYVVAWADQLYTNSLISPQPPQPALISTMRVARTGEVLDTKPQVLWSKSNVYSVGLASNGSGVEVVWMAPSPIGSRHLCVFHNDVELACNDLGLYDSPPFDLDLAWDGNEYVAAWTDPETFQVKALRLGVDDEPFVVSDNASQASIAASPGGATIAYVRVAGEPPYGSVPRVFTRTLVRSGAPPRRRATR
ncbi:MAG TPA: hypothetical protein VJZ76_17765 [Thermoanaerobaculia bacterium]|nr:hypothetical protein [Thermoanaerobaculia bacterium]